MLVILLSIPQMSFAEETQKSAYLLPPIAEQPHTNSNSKAIYEKQFDNSLSDIMELEIKSLSDASKDVNIRVRQLHMEGKNAEEISSSLIEEFGTTVEETAMALKEDRFSAVDINWALKNVFELEYAVAAPILKLRCTNIS